MTRHLMSAEESQPGMMAQYHGGSLLEVRFSRDLVGGSFSVCIEGEFLRERGKKCTLRKTF